MNKDKQILLGCDDTTKLIAVMNYLNRSGLFRYPIITAATGHALTQIATTCTPGLIILCFGSMQHTQSILNGELSIPLLCITGNADNQLLNWPGNQVVFTCTWEQSGEGNYLVSLVNSIMLLRNTDEQPPKPENTYEPAPSSGTRNLSRMVMELDQKIDVLKKVKDRIARLYPQVNDPVRSELNGIIHAIKNCIHDNKMWNDFKLYFENISPGFIARLTRTNPSLTEMDLKYCCYVKMNMTNDDIRILLGINQESVRTHKYRLKKKLALSREESLRAYLQAVG